jgi:tetratricopeptide repeat protein
MKSNRLLAWTLLAAFAASPAHADKARAKQLYTDGRKAYDLGKFAEAADLFEKGFAEQPDAVFLYNLGQCHRQLGNNDRALFFYRGYLRNKPDAENRAQVEQLIADLEKARQTQTQPPIAPIPPSGTAPPEVVPPRPAPPPAPPPAAVPPAAPAPAPAAAEPAAEPAATAPAATPSEAEVSMPAGMPPSSTQKYLAVGTLGVGVVMIGLGAVFGSQANSAKSDVEACDPWSSACQDTYDSGKSKAKLATIFLGLGGAAVVGGGIWTYFAFSHSSSQPTAHLDIDVGDGLRAVYERTF